jgi:hypothetical protein
MVVMENPVIQISISFRFKSISLSQFIFPESQVALNLETVMNHHSALYNDFHGFIIPSPADRKTGLPFLSKIS